MSLTSALYSGISGIVANGDAMGVIGNNIANVNTIGFKSGRTIFADVLYNTISSSNQGQVGRGVAVQAVDSQIVQGSFESTDSTTDLAIQGDSLFVVQGPTGRYYTRAGAFHYDNMKTLVTPDNYEVLGFGIVKETGKSDGILGPINMTNFATTAPQASSKFDVVLNLESTSAIPGTSTSTKTTSVVIDSNLDAGTAVGGSVGPLNYTVYDDAGNPHAAAITFTKTAADSWNWSADFPTASTGSPINGSVTFAPSGAIVTQVPQGPQTFTLNGSAQDVTLDMSTLTQNAAATTVAVSASGTANTAPWDPSNPVSTSNYSMSSNVYDSQGNAHTMTVYFRKTGANAWAWHAMIPDALEGSPVDGTLQFNSAGSLIAQTPLAAGSSNITFPGGVTAPQSLSFEFAQGGTTQYASPSVVSSLTQDGFPQGSLVKVTVDDKGYVNGTYSNGRLVRLAQIALAKFPAPNQLSKFGSSLYEETGASGAASINTGSTPGFGKVFSNSLEQSNVDLASQFVKMITTQRGYSANSKTITTTDEMLQEVLSLKR